jgi:hypothetical protein
MFSPGPGSGIKGLDYYSKIARKATSKWSAVAVHCPDDVLEWPCCHHVERSPLFGRAWHRITSSLQMLIVFLIIIPTQLPLQQPSAAIFFLVLWLLQAVLVKSCRPTQQGSKHSLHAHWTAHGLLSV